VIFHEAVHWHLSAHEGYMPPWLAEGMAELYSSFELPDEKTYAFGATIKEHLALLNRGKLLPLAQLVNTGRDSILYNEGNRANIFYAESWAFVHFLFHGEFSPGKEAVQRYVELMPTAASTEAAFTEAFGANYAGVEQRFRDYIQHGFARKYSYPRATEDIAKLLKFATASPAELELAKGSLLLGTRGAEVAEPILQRAGELNPSDPRAWELLGHIAVSRKDYETAAKVLKRAAEAGSTSYLVYHNLAVSRTPDSTGLRSPAVFLDAEAMDLAAADYRRAIALAPAHIPSYEGLAGLMHGMKTFVASDADLLVRGALQSPGDSMIEAGIAAAEVRAGHVTDGITRLERLCARHPESSEPGLVYARDILAIETIQREIEEINRLGQENKLEEILAIADKALARPLPPEHRQAMQDVRHRTADLLKLGAAITLANKGDDAGAKKIVDEVIASNPDRSVLEEARRLEKELARRGAK
jgi:tetratricopeptide (TPR) repeat protein